MDWKGVETRVAKYLGGQRVPITGRIGKPDVEHVHWAIEVKARTAMPKWIVLLYELLKRDTSVFYLLGDTQYLCIRLDAIEELNSVLTKESNLLIRKKVTGWLQYGLDQALLSSVGTDKIPVTILHQKNWRYSDCICLIPITYLGE